MQYVAFLRSINVGKHNRIKMSAVLQFMADLKFEKSRTYLQSGNLLFESDHSSGDLELMISSAFDQLDMSVPCLVRTVDELRQIVGTDCWPADFQDESHQFVTFLGSVVSGVELLKSARGDAEIVGCTQREVFSVCTLGAKGYGNPIPLIEKQIKCKNTSRNIRVVKAICDLF